MQNSELKLDDNLMDDIQFKNNFTIMPNVVLDTLMPTLSGTEEKIIRVVCRQTYGWWKDSDKISNSQMCKKTGVEEKALKRAIKNLADRKIIIRHIGNGRVMTEYSINKKCSEWEGVISAPPQIAPSEGGEKVSPGGDKKSLNKRNYQNKISKEKEGVTPPLFSDAENEPEQKTMPQSKPTTEPSDETRLHNAIKDIFDKGYTELTGSRISWVDKKEINNHQTAIKNIIARTSGTYDQRFTEIRARARKLFELVSADRAKNGFWWQNQFLYSTLNTSWNKITPDKTTLNQSAPTKPTQFTSVHMTPQERDYMHELSDQGIMAHDACDIIAERRRQNGETLWTNRKPVKAPSGT